MAVKTHNYEVIREDMSPSTNGIFLCVEELVTKLSETESPEQLEGRIRSAIDNLINEVNANKEVAEHLIWGGGASHLWISRKIDTERIILIRFENEY